MHLEVERIDKTVRISKLAAERHCKHRFLHRDWSPKLVQHALTQKFWKVLLSSRRLGNDATKVLQDLIKRLPTVTNLDLQLTTEEVLNNLSTSRSQYKDSKKRASQLRNEFLDELAKVWALRGRTDIATAIRCIKDSRKIKDAHTYITRVFKPRCSHGLTHLKLPTTHPYLNESHVDTDSDASSDNSTTPSDAASTATLPTEIETQAEEERQPTTWTTIVDPDEVERVLLRRNQDHYHQAAATPFGKPPLSTKLGVTGTSPFCKSVLDGTVDYTEFTSEAQEFLLQLKRDPNLPTISSTVSLDDFRQGIIKWRKDTSTSPSGLHLGHLKALTIALSDNTDTLATELLSVNHLLLEISRLRKQPLKRWLDEVEVMLEKDPGDPKLHRLRIICLYEADYNLFLKLLWAKRLVPHAEKHGLLGDAQGGNRAGRTSNDVSAHKVLQFVYARITRTNIASFDNDAKSCYDRIVGGLALLACLSWGMPEDACEVHGLAIALMRHYVKTATGISSQFFTSTEFKRLFGSGQGSGGSPPALACSERHPLSLPPQPLSSPLILHQCYWH